MGSDAKRIYGAVGRDDLLRFEPEDLTLIEDPKHALYDERVTIPLDERLVLDIMVSGVLEPIIVTLDGQKKNGKPNVVVLDGIQRTRATREANKRLKQQGKETIFISAMRRRGETWDLYGVKMSTFIRQDDLPLSKARKAAKFLQMGRSVEEAAIKCGVTPPTIENWLKLLESSVAVQKAVERGEIPLTIAVKLAKLPMDEQPEALEKIRAEGVTHGEKAHEAANGATGHTPRARMRGRKHLSKLLTRLQELEKDDKPLPSVTAVIKYILGDEKALGKKWLGAP